MQYTHRLEQLAEKLAIRWKNLIMTKVLGQDIDGVSESIFFAVFIGNMYKKNQRWYHNLFHLEQMLKEFDAVRDKLKQPECVEFAIFLHDIIYVIGRKDNETASGRIAEAILLRMGANVLKIYRVLRLITVATKHPKSPKVRLTSDEKYMSDLDLYGFSLSYDAVLGQSCDVRREFSEFSDEEFRKGQGNFLSQMLTRRIYLTDHFSQYELAARENIRRVLQNMDQVVCARPTDKRS